MLKKSLFVLGSLGVLLVPALAFAQNQANLNQLNSVVQQSGSLVSSANTVLNYVIGLLITIAIIVFIINVIKFILSQDATKQKDAKYYMIYSVVAIAVILGIFGLANFLLNTFGIGSGGLNGNQIPSVPTASTQGSVQFPNTPQQYNP